MSKDYIPAIVHYSANPQSHSTVNTKFVDQYGYIESNQDVVWFHSSEYKEVIKSVLPLNQHESYLTICQMFLKKS